MYVVELSSHNQNMLTFSAREKLPGSQAGKNNVQQLVHLSRISTKLILDGTGVSIARNVMKETIANVVPYDIIGNRVVLIAL